MKQFMLITITLVSILFTNNVDAQKKETIVRKGKHQKELREHELYTIITVIYQKEVQLLLQFTLKP